MNLKPIFEQEVPVDLNITPTDIAQELRRANPARYVFNPASEWVVVPFGRQVLIFPPDLPGAPLVAHPAERIDGKPVMVPANGTLKVQDNFGPVLDTKTRMFLKGIRPIQGESADDFLRFIAGTTKYRNNGFTWLRNDGQDEQRKRDAKKLYQSARRGWAEQELATRAETVANFKKLPGSAGQPLPPPKPTQIEAQEFLDSLLTQQAGVGTLYSCEHGCAVATNDFAKYAAHMKARHKEDVAEDASEVSADDLAADQVKRKPGRPRKVEAVA